MLIKILAILMFILSLDSAFAELPSSSVSAIIRIAKHKEYIRIVIEAPQFITDKATVVYMKGTDIKIKFTHDISLKTSTNNDIIALNKKIEIVQGVFITAGNMNAIFSIANIDDIKVMKLADPYRLIVDAYFKPIVINDNTSETSQHTNTANLSNIILIDPGHGGSDSGFKYKTGAEKDFVFNLAKDISTSASKAGIKNILSRKNDVLLSYSDRLKIISHAMPILVISLHTSNGKEILIYIDNVVKKDHQINKLAAQLSSDLSEILDAKAEVLSVPLFEASKINGNYIRIELPSPDLLRYDRNTRKRLIDAFLKLMDK